MKKILMVLSVFMIFICIGGCDSTVTNNTPTPEPIIQVDPTALISEQTAREITGSELILDGGASTEDDGVKTALYRTEPIGNADIVKVEVRQYSQTVSKEDIKQIFDNAKAKRPKAETIDDLGCDAYIAFPSVNIYKDGYLVTITAGSGSDDGQKNMLKSFAQTAVDNLNALIS